MANDKSARKAKFSTRLVATILFAVGFIISVVGAWLTLDSYRFAGNSVAVTGTVVSITRNSGSDGVTYRPVVGFIDLQGLKRRGTTALSSSGYDFPIGTKLDIRYETSDPSEVRVDSWFAVWGFSLIILVSGIILLVISKTVLRRVGGVDGRSMAGKQPDKRTNAMVSAREKPEKYRDEDSGYIPTVRRNR